MRFVLDLLMRILNLLLGILALLRMMFWRAVTLFGIAVAQIHTRNDIFALLTATAGAAATR